MPRIFVDADACPVKDEIMLAAERHGAEVIMVSNGGIRPSRFPGARIVTVESGADVADMWIAENAGAGDICVTGDIVLASRCLESGALAIRHDGEAFTPANIGERLAMRDLMADIRSSNPLEAFGGGKTFSKAERSRFLDQIDRLLRRAARP